MSAQAPRELFGLTHPAFVERYVGALQNARRVAVSLAMTHEQDRHAALLAAFVRAGEFRLKLGRPPTEAASLNVFAAFARFEAARLRPITVLPASSDGEL
jgi:hypothetical protein